MLTRTWLQGAHRARTGAPRRVPGGEGPPAFACPPSVGPAPWAAPRGARPRAAQHGAQVPGLVRALTSLGWSGRLTSLGWPGRLTSLGWSRRRTSPSAAQGAHILGLAKAAAAAHVLGLSRAARDRSCRELRWGVAPRSGVGLGISPRPRPRIPRRPPSSPTGTRGGRARARMGGPGWGVSEL